MHSNHRILIWLTGLIGSCPVVASATESIHVNIVETQTGAALPCRVYVKDEVGRPVQAKGLPFWKDHFVCPGQVKLDLAPGFYTYEIDRGPEYFLKGGQWTIQAGQPLVVTYSLQRMVDLAAEGWWSGETHVHRPASEMELLMRAADLYVAPVITWWNNTNPWNRRELPNNPLVVMEDQRFFHLLAGEDERGGGALLYFNLNQPLPIAGSQREHPSAMKFLEQARQSGAMGIARIAGATTGTNESAKPSGQMDVWVDIEKPFWWDVPIWAASGWVDSVGIVHNHMQRAGMLDNEAWGKARNRQRYPGPLGNGHWTQQIYYHLLNAGLRLPPTAGSASGVLNNPVGYNRVYVHLGPDWTYQTWWEGLRAGRVFVSNGPLLRCQANGAWPGRIFKAKAGQSVTLHLEAQIDSRDPFSEIEVVRNGVVEQAVRFAAGTQRGSLGTLTFHESGWCLARVLADVPDTFRFGCTGPFYVEIGDATNRISRTSAQFFLDWVRERKQQLQLDDATQRASVLRYIEGAEQFWQSRVHLANAN